MGAPFWEGIKTGTERTPSFNYFFIVIITFCVHFLHVVHYFTSDPIVDFYTNCISDNLSSPNSALLIARDRSTFCPAQLRFGDDG